MAPVPWQPSQCLRLSKGKLPVPDGTSKSSACWHPWPQAGPGLFSPIKNGLDQNYKRGILLLTADDCSSGSQAPFCATATDFWVLSK